MPIDADDFALLSQTLPPQTTTIHRPNVFPGSASAISAILAFHFPDGTIVDVNYGLGTFYRECPHRHVVGVDLKLPASVLADNKHLPFIDNAVTVGVCDPPYKRGDGWKYEGRYGLAPHTEPQVTRSYFALLLELIRVSQNGVIIKVQDGTDGHRFFARHIDIAGWMHQTTGLHPYDIAINVRHTMPSSMVQGIPHFFQQGVSYFLIYKWARKYPFRPVRF